MKIRNFKILFYILFLILELKSQAQLMSKGNVFIHNKGNKTLFFSTLDFSKGKEGSQPGIIGTERSYPRGYLSFAENATYKNVSDSTFVDGYVRSFNPSFFIFPIGDNKKFRPAAISNSSISQPNSAAYYGVDASIAITSSLKGGLEPVLPTGGPFNVSLMDTTLLKVSNREYWDIDGQSKSKISLSWDDSSLITKLTESSLERLTIVGWNGIKWIAINSKVDNNSFLGKSSNLNNGSISTLDSIVPDTYFIYTFGRKVCKPWGAPIISCSNQKSCDTICKSENTRTYTISGISNVTGYYWKATNGVVITTGQGTSSIQVNISNALEGTSIISVVPFNSCDSMTSISYKFIIIPASACQNIVNINDTCISTSVSKVVIGPVVNAPNGGKMSVSIFGLKKAGQATIDTSNALITLTPIEPQFLGKDSLYRVICFKNLIGVISCDTSLICITNVSPRTSPIYDTTLENNAVIMTSVPLFTFQGGTPKLSFISPTQGEAILNADGSVSYKPKNGFSGNDSFTIIRCDSFNNCVSNTYYIFIAPNRKIEPANSIIPNYFSPNGDGVNDYFDLSALTQIYPELKLEVYNRWGNSVYRSNGVYQNNWYGNHGVNSEPLPDGVYYYLIELYNQFKDVKTGFVEIMR